MADNATYLSQLHQILNQHFNLAEIRTLCLDLNVDYESVAGEEKPSRIRELLLTLGRNGRLSELVALAQQQRPLVEWPPVPDNFELPESLEKAVPANQYNAYGDIVYGDKILGDKVMGDKHEHHHHPPEKKLPPPPRMSLKPPRDFVPRPQEYEQLIGYLLAEDKQTVAITATLQGAGGFGKTTLAQKICQDDRILDAFPDGILWATIGDDRTKVEPELKMLYQALTGEEARSVNEYDATVQLSAELDKRRCLLVIDDVWNKSHLIPFLQGGEQCARLITTRISSAVPKTSHVVTVDAMQKAEAVELLGKGLEASDNVKLLKLAQGLGKYPILLNLVNSVLRQRSKRQSLDEAIRYVYQVLKRRGVIGFDVRNATSRELAVSQTIEISLDQLKKDERQRYNELAIFPEDSDIPLKTVHRLWQATANWDEFETEELCDLLQQFSLLLDFNLANQTIRLHDVFRNYLLKKASAEHVRNWHNALVTGYREQCAGIWWQLSDDGYVYKNLLWHMSKARQQDSLEQLLFDYEWLDAKLQKTDALSLISDFDLRRDTERHSKLSLLQHALQMSVSNLVQDKNQLISQLYNRLKWCGKPFEPFLNKLQRQKRVYWLQTQSPSLIPPAGNLLFNLRGHTAGVDNLLLTPDGRLISSCSSLRNRDHTVKVWDLSRGVMLHNLEGHTSGIDNLLLTPDGRLISSCRTDPTVKVWDLAQGALLHNLEGHSTGVHNLLLTPDGRLVSSCGSSESGDHTVKVWDLTNGVLLHNLEGHSAGVHNLLLTPDGRLISSCGRFNSDHTVKIWDLTYGVLLRNLEGHTAGVDNLLLAPHNLLITSCSGDIFSRISDHTVKVWNLESGDLLYSLEGHSDGVANLFLLPDDRLASSCSSFTNHDHTVKVWDLTNGVLLHNLEGHTAGVDNLIFATKDRLITSSCSNGILGSDHTVKVWDLMHGVLLHSLEGHTDGVSNFLITQEGLLISSCGKRYSNSEDHTVKIWDMTNGVLLHNLEGHTAGVDNLILTSDGLLISCCNSIYGSSRDHTVKIWDPLRGILLNNLNGHTGGVTSLLLAPESRLISSCGSPEGSRDHTVKVWDLACDPLLHNSQDHIEGVTTLLVTPEGLLISSCGNSKFNTMKVWSLESSILLHSLEGHISTITNLLPTTDGHLISSCGRFDSHDHTVKVWNLTNGVLLHTLEGHTAGVDNLLLTPDGRLVSTSIFEPAGKVKVWDLAQGALLHNLEGHSAGVHNLLLTPDGRLISSCRTDPTVKVWDLASGVILHSLDAHNGGVDKLLLTPNGHLISSCGNYTSGGFTVFVWDLASGILLHTLKGHTDYAGTLLLTPDGRLVSSCHRLGHSFGNPRDHTVKIWDLQRGVLLHSLEGHTDYVDTLLLTPDGRLVSSCHRLGHSFGNPRDHTVKIWDLQRGVLLHSLEEDISGIKFTKLFSLNHILTVSGPQLTIWNLDEGRKLTDFTADAPIESCIVAPNNRIILGDGIGRVHFLKLIQPGT